MAMTTKDSRDHVRHSSDIVQVIQELGVELKALNGYYQGLCPFHDDHNPSLIVYPDSQRFVCFACQAKGDVFEFVRKLKGVGFTEALAFLASRAGMAPKGQASVQAKAKPEPAVPLTEGTVRILTLAVEYYHEQLPSRVREYLTKERGLTEEIIEGQKIGFSIGQGLLEYLQGKGYTPEQAAQAGVITEGGKEFLKGHIVFPHWLDGQVVYLSGRGWPEKSHRKLPGKRVPLKHLYLEDALKGKEVIIAEGEIDTLTLAQAGFPACGILGTTGFKQEWVERFNQVETVYLALDGDEAGRQAQVKLAKAFGGKAKVVQFPESSNGSGVKDWNELLVKGYKGNTLAFKGAFEELLKGAEPVLAGEAVGISLGLTDLGNARRLVAQHRGAIRFCYLWDKWLYWTGDRWMKDDVGETERYAKAVAVSLKAEAEACKDEYSARELTKWAKRAESSDRIHAMIRLARSEPGIPLRPDEVDPDPWLLNVANGTLDLKRGELKPHDPKDMITRLAPVAYDPKARCPLWEKFLLRVMEGDLELIDFLQRAVGYSLTGDTSEQALFFLHGVGANGKTTFVQTVSALMGDYAMQASTEMLMVQYGNRIPNDIARLQGARFVNTVEIEEGRRLAEGLVKSLTGGDTLTARFLWGEWFEFTPQFKIFLAANHKPVIKGTDHAIWRRIKLIPFEVTIPKQEQDRELARKLQAELPGILNWALEGCLQWQRHGLQEPERVMAATESYREESDVLARFLAECTVPSSTGTVQAGRLYARYKEWCEANGERPWTNTLFGKRLKERGFLREHRMYGKFYVGLELVSEGDSEPEP